MSDILNKSINGSGYNEKYGLLGSNRATEERVKLFPRTGDKLVIDIQNKLKHGINLFRKHRPNQG
jgi:hypothetical protein